MNEYCFNEARENEDESDIIYISEVVDWVDEVQISWQVELPLSISRCCLTILAFSPTAKEGTVA
jgi:hypothetical protein